jgi:crotonobetainyl-CoA:carnitine CoA-transferase CaiB-like acyl-CoA transferase
LGCREDLKMATMDDMVAAYARVLATHAAVARDYNAVVSDLKRAIGTNLTEDELRALARRADAVSRALKAAEEALLDAKKIVTEFHTPSG